MQTLTSKIRQEILRHYPDADADWLADTTMALAERKAFAFNPSTAEIGITNAYAVRELAPKLLENVKQTAVDPNADFDTKLENAAKNLQRLGIHSTIRTGESTPFDADAIAEFVKANPTMDGGQ